MFHIPVMGTGFSIDTPLVVAKYGISSVISLVDDILIEQMRKYHCEREGEPFEPIIGKADDGRARRITAYLNLMDRLIQRQVEALRDSPFEEGSEITRYYEMLPEGSLKKAYRAMLEAADPADRSRRQDELRRRADPGDINANIMTKVDAEVYIRGKKMAPEFNDAMSALRGYANSSLRSSIIFSAGFNPRLYGYIARFDDFFLDADGDFKKKIVLKVSDYRSALIQGKYLAKKGLWVSEYRVESGLNCGGHVFATVGHLLGPILEKFKQNRSELVEITHQIYRKALGAADRPAGDHPPEVRITVQGGIGTSVEQELMLKYYEVDATGWATPFLLVPEVTNVDDDHLKKLSRAVDGDVYLSDGSPFGVPFWNLRESASEEARRQRILKGVPGSACPKGFIRLNKEFSDVAICRASRVYQKKKIVRLNEEEHSEEQLEVLEEDMLAKSCICHDLAGGVTRKLGIDPAAKPSICCGPGIAYFSKISTLEEMVGHIYGRLSLITQSGRPHMFVRELMLYVDFLRKEMVKASLDLSAQKPKYFDDFQANLLEGIEYYRHRAEQIAGEKRESFIKGLNLLRAQIESLAVPV